MREVRTECLTRLFNKTFKTKKMSTSWRYSIIVVFIFKNKGNIQSCTNCRWINLLSHTMRSWREL